MQFVERHDIPEGSELYMECDLVSFKSKNIYNSHLYFVRQRFFDTSLYTSYSSVTWAFAQDDQFDYRQLPAKVAQQTMKICDRNFLSFWRSLKDYKKHPEKYNGRPHLPNYLDSDKGRFVTVWTKQAISKKKFDKTGYLCLSGTSFKIKTLASWDRIQQVRLVPKTGKYVFEVIYTVPDVELKEFNGKIAAADFGVDNLITLTFNIPGVAPVIIDGKKLKSINQYFNKRIAENQEKLFKKHKDKKHTSKKLRRLYRKRQNSIETYLHKASRMAVNHLVSNDVTEFIIGLNKHWKQDINIGDKSTQNFVYIPYEKLINMLTYKCQQAGISVKLQEESYTSKASFLDMDDIPVYKEVAEGEEKPKYVFSGYRKFRGLYKRKYLNGDAAFINADINGSYNILRKGKPTAFANGVVGVVVRPVRYCICKPKSKRQKPVR